MKASTTPSHGLLPETRYTVGLDPWKHALVLLLESSHLDWVRSSRGCTLYSELGITITANVVHILDRKEHSRAKRIAKAKTTSAKKDKLKRKFTKQVESEAQAKTDRSKREGTYKSGQNMQGEEEEQPRRANKKAGRTWCVASVDSWIARTSKVRWYHVSGLTWERSYCCVVNTRLRRSEAC
jgi:hypothetical protein